MLTNNAKRSHRNEKTDGDGKAERRGRSAKAASESAHAGKQSKTRNADGKVGD